MAMNVLLIGFNRSDFVKYQLRMLNDISSVTSVLLVLDGARAGNQRDLQEQSDLKNFIEDFTPNYDLNVYFGKSNRGCKRGVEFAIDYFFEQFNDGIILEDDCQVDARFFDFYMSHRHKLSDQNTFMLTACSFIEKAAPNSHFFSRYPHIWGWATTSRNWNLYRNSSSKVPVISLIGKLLGNGILESIYFIPKWLQSRRGSIDTWDYDLSYFMLINDLLCIVPGVNLVRNVGIDVGGAHELLLMDDLTNKENCNGFKATKTIFSDTGILYDRSIIKRRLLNKIRKILV